MLVQNFHFAMEAVMDRTLQLRRYLDLERRLLDWRREHSEDTPEEDQLLDQMDEAWWAMSDQERVWVNAREQPK